MGILQLQVLPLAALWRRSLAESDAGTTPINTSCGGGQKLTSMRQAAYAAEVMENL